MSEGKITSRINSSQLKKHLKNIIPIDYVFLNNNKNFREEKILNNHAESVIFKYY